MDPAERGGLVPELLATQRQRVLRYCLSLLGDQTDAEDATQETFLRTIPHLERIGSDPGAYLTTVARGVCTDLLRRRTRRDRQLPLLEVADRAHDPEKTVTDAALLRDVWRLLRVEEQALFAQTFAGLRQAEMAERSGLTETSVAVTIHRARRRLRGLAAAVSLAGVAAALRRLAARGVRRAIDLPTSAGSVAPLIQASMSISVLALLTTIGSLGAAPVATPSIAVATHVRSAAAATTVGVTGLLREGSVVRRVNDGTVQATPAPTQRPAPRVVASALPLPAAKASDTSFDSMAAAPSSDGSGSQTLFAAGTVQRASASVPCQCPAVFRSTDGGASWTALPSVGYRGGSLLVSPGYARDHRLFAMTDAGLEQSNDGGDSFQVVVPVPGLALLDPRAPADAPRVVVVPDFTSALLVYDVVRQATNLPGAQLAPGTFLHGAAFTDGGQSLLVSLETAQYSAILQRCDLSAGCTLAGTLPVADSYQLDAATAPATDGTVVAWSTQRAFLSEDGGRTFQLLPTSSQTVAAVDVSVDAGGSPRIAMALLQPSSTQSWRDQVVLRDGQASWRVLDAAPGVQAIAAMLVLPNGHVVVAPSASPMLGLLCSPITRADWSPGC